MNQPSLTNEEKKAAMKKLRQDRKEYIQKTSARVSRQNKDIKAIKEELQKGDRTVPEIAEAIDLPAHEVLWYMAALKKYGEIAEAKKESGYYRYQLKDNQ
jgi:predicted transcriptional regulator